MTITIPSGRTLPLKAKSGGGFASSAIDLGEGGAPDLGEAPPGSTLIIQDDFSSGISVNWSNVGEAVYVSGENAVRFDYDSTQGVVSGLKQNLSSQSPGICADFEAKLTGGPRGMKFFKCFGESGSESSSVANATFGLDYNGVNGGPGEMKEVSQGNGTGLTNDTQFTIRLAGTTGGTPREGLLNIIQSTQAFDPYLDEGWHRFRMYYLLNSGDSAQTEVADGKLRLEIDGVVRLQAEGFFNRNPDNPRYFKQFTLADYSPAGTPCSLFYRNVSFWDWDGVAY